MFFQSRAKVSTGLSYLHFTIRIMYAVDTPLRRFSVKLVVFGNADDIFFVVPKMVMLFFSFQLSFLVLSVQPFTYGKYIVFFFCQARLILL